MKHSPTAFLDKPDMKEIKHINVQRLGLFFLWSLGFSSFFVFFLLYSPNPFRLSLQDHLHRTTSTTNEQENYCDLFKGKWIRDLKRPLYTNWSCKTLPDSKNCEKHGRVDVDFQKWRWKPDGCDLPTFDPKTFLRIVRGKKLAFVGDSVARNHMESLLCLLSQEETPTNVYNDSKDRSPVWYFPSHNFTLQVIWTKFLVVGEEREINGSLSGVFDLHLDKIDQNWANKLPTMDYAILSDAHWFFRKNYVYEGGKPIGCIFCNEPNITDYGLSFPVRRTVRTVLQYILNCKDCKGLLTLLRTFSPAHFENGAWNTGGNCNRTEPINHDQANFQGNDWEIRRVQVEEVERAREEGKKKGIKLEALDVTRAMLMRPDGHPGSHWNNIGMTGFNDCVHWCLPGPIDAWNDLLVAILSRESSNSSLD